MLPSRAFLIAMIIATLAPGLASAQSGAAPAGAVGVLAASEEGRAAPAAGAPSQEAAAAWARTLRSARAADAPAVGQVEAVEPASGGELGGGLLAFVALLVGGCAGAAGWYAGRQRSVELAPPQVVMAPPTQAPAPVMPELPQTALLIQAIEPVDGHGDLLVVEVEADLLLLYIDAERDAATLLARLGEPPEDGDWELDRIAERVVAAIRAGQPAEAVLTAAAAIPREVPVTAAPRAPGQDEDLDVLLDDLLGKVRDLKPLAKAVDEP